MRGRLSVAAFNSAHFKNFIFASQRFQRSDRRLHDIRVITRAERFREHVANPSRFDNRAHAAAGNDAGKTLTAASTAEKSVLGKNKPAANRASAEVVGKAIAERARGKKIESVVFDRGGFQYQGKVKALADAAREGGLKF